MWGNTRPRLSSLSLGGIGAEPTGKRGVRDGSPGGRGGPSYPPGGGPCGRAQRRRRKNCAALARRSRGARRDGSPAPRRPQIPRATSAPCACPSHRPRLSPQVSTAPAQTNRGRRRFGGLGASCGASGRRRCRCRFHDRDRSGPRLRRRPSPRPRKPPPESAEAARTCAARTAPSLRRRAHMCMRSEGLRVQREAASARPVPNKQATADCKWGHEHAMHTARAARYAKRRYVEQKDPPSRKNSVSEDVTTALAS